MRRLVPPTLILPLLAGLSLVGAARAATVVEVYKSPACGCCAQWVQHLRQAGFAVDIHDVGDVPAARRALGMPERYGACHTARAGPYRVEGHVPAADIRRLLAERPDALGIAVPSMPPGSPGMEGPVRFHYRTLLVKRDGSAATFARH